MGKVSFVCLFIISAKYKFSLSNVCFISYDFQLPISVDIIRQLPVNYRLYTLFMSKTNFRFFSRPIGML